MSLTPGRRTSLRDKVESKVDVKPKAVKASAGKVKAKKKQDLCGYYSAYNQKLLAELSLSNKSE